MSSLVFPSSLPGLKIDVSRAPDHGTNVVRTISRKDLRTTWETYPIYRYTVSFEFLRSSASLKEFHQFFTHLSRHAGRLDSFLLNDPEDNTVTDHGFAAGDGVTPTFQLQRTQGGALTDAAGATYPAQSKPYSNLLKNSSFESGATSWSIYNNTFATEPHTSQTIPGRNGGFAERVSWGTNNTATKGLNQTSVSKVAGQWYTVAYYARATGTVIGQTMQLAWNTAPNSTIAIANPALAAGWQLYLFQIRWGTAQTVDPDFFVTVLNAASCFGDLDFDEFLFTAGQFDATTLPQPFATPASAAATRVPSYWQTTGDGFEPIFDLASDPTIYQDGDWFGRRQLYPYARTNVVPFSEQLDNAAWSKTGVTVTANQVTAPDGAVTGDQIGEGVANSQHLVNEVTSPAAVQGELRRYSIFVRANNLPNIQFAENNAGINFNLGTGAIDSTVGTVLASGVILDPLWFSRGWWRIWFTTRILAADIGSMFLFGSPASSPYSTAAYTGTNRSFYAWGADCRRVSDLGPPDPYIKTPSSAAVTVTDYSVDSLGKVTPAAVLPAGAFLSWDGTYYRRVRFEDDTVPADRIVSGFWKTASLALVSVKP